MSDPIPNLLAAINPARIRADVDALASFHSRHVASGDANIGAAARYIQSRFTEAAPGRLQVYFDTFEEDVARLAGHRLTMSNVVAELPGTARPERVIVVGGHYDSRATDPADAESRAPGANDDASGVALTLELARVLSGRDWPCTLVFIAFTGEEMGLLGARNWARGAKGAGCDVAAMLNNDMVGNTHDARGQVVDDRVRVFSEGMQAAGDQALLRRLGLESDSPSRQLARYAHEAGARYQAGFGIELVMRPDRLGRGGDHLPFSDQGFAAIRFVEALEDYDRQHQDLRVEDGRSLGDLPEHVDEAYTARIARLNCAVTASLALAPPPPAHATIERAVSHSPRLSWAEVEGATYAVLSRRTTAPLWEQRREAGAATSMDIDPREVNDCFFAVQAVAANGFGSLPAVALPLARPTPPPQPA